MKNDKFEKQCKLPDTMRPIMINACISKRKKCVSRFISTEDKQRPSWSG